MKSGEVIARKELWNWAILGAQTLAAIRVQCPDSTAAKMAGQALCVLPMPTKLIDLEYQEAQ